MSDPLILVPLDGTGFAEAALPHALRLADDLDAGIQIASVYDDHPTAAGWVLDPAKIRAGLLAYQEDVIKRIAKLSDRPVSSVVLGGLAARTLTEYVQRTEPTLVVMATHGRGPVGRAWFGSVADRLVRHASMPVLLVKPLEDEEANTVMNLAAPVASTVVALDGSRRAEASLRWAFRLTAKDGSISLVRAVPEPNVPSVYLPDATTLREEAIAKGVEDAEGYLSALLGTLDGPQTVSSEVFPGGNVAGDILRHAGQTDADLIVIASHGRGGLARTVLGSVADKVVRGADRPVLVVRSA